MYELVVARYIESLDWLTLVPVHWTITIYNKGGSIEIPASVKERTSVRFLPNIGREGDTFLRHIISQHEELADVTAFVQGNPFSHVSPEYFVALLNEEADTTTCKPICDRQPNGWKPVEGLLFCDSKGMPHHHGLPVGEKAAEIGLQPLWPLGFAPGAMWLAGRFAIQHTSYAEYSDILNWLHEDELNGYCLERLWSLLFGKVAVDHGAPWVVFYTHHKVPDKVLANVWNNLWEAGADPTRTLVIADYPDSRLPTNVKTYYLPIADLGWQRAIFHKIRLALLQIPAGSVVAMAEHDVLYPKGYFNRIKDTQLDNDLVYYWKSCLHLSLVSDKQEFFYSDQNHTRTLLSGCFGRRDTILRAVNKRIGQVEALAEGEEYHPFELGLDGNWGYVYEPDSPLLDIRHGSNATTTGHDKGYYEPLAHHPYWGDASILHARLI